MYPRITLKRDPNKPVRRAAVLIPFMNTYEAAYNIWSKIATSLWFLSDFQHQDFAF